jgi:hypothetical protein
MKALSEIISVILILLIVIALIILLWIFSTNLITPLTSIGIQKIEKTINMMNGCLRIEIVNPTTGEMILRNCGTVTVSSCDVYVDDIKASSFSNITSENFAVVRLALTAGRHDIFVACYNAKSDHKIMDFVYNEAPQWFNSYINSTLAGSPVLHSLEWTSTLGLSGYIFQFCNGTWNGTDCPNASGVTMITLNSSNIIIDDDSQNAASSTTGYMDDIIDGGVSYGDYATNWNISSLPVGITIADAKHCMYVATDHVDDFNETVSTWGVQNYSWSATPRNVWSNITNPNHGTNFANQTVPSAVGWWCFNITSWVASEYTGGKQNLTVDYIVEYDADGYDDYIIVQSAEGLNKPYLNITYSTVGSGGWANDIWVPMTGATNWSNVTKVVNSTVESRIAWAVYANDTSNNWNSSNAFTFSTT